MGGVSVCVCVCVCVVGVSVWVCVGRGECVCVCTGVNVCGEGSLQFGPCLSSVHIRAMHCRVLPRP